MGSRAFQKRRGREKEISEGERETKTQRDTERQRENLVKFLN